MRDTSTPRRMLETALLLGAFAFIVDGVLGWAKSGVSGASTPKRCTPGKERAARRATRTRRPPIDLTLGRASACIGGNEGV